MTGRNHCSMLCNARWDVGQGLSDKSDLKKFAFKSENCPEPQRRKPHRTRPWPTANRNKRDESISLAAGFVDSISSTGNAKGQKGDVPSMNHKR
mmetsp:Transcript_34464/g.79554  ORF Transcript_34464/g.79554 Transcript_34464/m.79554 type:complete len:94 (-) Transcript_34464:259-540(-)